MLNKTIRILNFDDSITSQHKLISEYNSEIINLKDMVSEARFWIKPKDKEEVKRRISGTKSDAITFLGSGDFHHISNILIDEFKEPISVISFDFHPDWNTLLPVLSCGSWVSETLKNKNILKCISVGVSSKDMGGLNIYAGDLASLKDDRLEIYPYSHKPSLVLFKKVPDNISIEINRYPLLTKICWNELKNKSLIEFFLHIVRRLPSRNVYITIDKDVLSPEYAVTNWEEGMLPLEGLLVILKIIKDHLNVVGVDICGDYSKIRIHSVFKKMISYLGHPKDMGMDDLGESFINGVNEETNLKILEVLSS